MVDERAPRTGYRVRALARRERALVLAAIVAFALAPLVAGALALAQGWQATGDVAIIGLRATDAWTADAPLVGQPTTAEEFTGTRSNHPGPIEFWVLGLTIRALGDQAGIVLGAAAINAAALAGVAWVAFRRGGLLLLGLTGAATAALIAALGPASLYDAFNSELGTYPMLLALLATWSIAVGDLRLAPVLAAAVTVLAQVHVAGAAFALPLVLVAAGMVAWVARRHPATIRRDAPHLLGAGAILAVGWLPPLLQELSAGPSNVAALWTAATEPRPRIGLAFLLERLATAVGPIPIFVRDTGRFGFLADASAAGVVAAALVIGGLASLGLAARRPGRRSDPARLVALVLVAIGTSVLAGAGQPPLAAFRADGTRWLWVASLAVWLAAAWVGWHLVPEAARDRARQPLALGALAVAAVALVASVATTDLADQRDGALMAGTEAAADATVAALAPGTYQVRYEGDRALVTVGPGIAYRMEAAGRRIAIDDSVLTRGYGPERTREQPTDGVVRITSDATATAGEGEELIATQPLGPDGAAGTIKVFVTR